MKKNCYGSLPRPPARPELADVPIAPRLTIEISRMLRSRMLREESGVMAQSTARLVMSHLAVSGSMGQLEIVRLTRLKASTVSVLLRRMEAEGYILRTPDESDGRAMRVTLTEKGLAYDKERLQRLSTNDHQAMKSFTKEEEQQLESLLLRMRDNLGET